MAIDFKCSEKIVQLFFEGAYLTECPRNHKLQIGGSEFLMKFNGTNLENIPSDISFYIEDVQDFYPSLSAISLDNSEKGMTVLMMSKNINLGNWMKPFSFDEYILKIESIIKEIQSPIKRYYKNSSPNFTGSTILEFEFLIKCGDLLDEISKYIVAISSAQDEAERLLNNRNLSNPNHLSRKWNFVEGEKFQLEEDLLTEFKEVKGENAVKSIQNVVDEYLLAFFNSQGGSVFWGIDDAGIVKSLNLTSKAKDQIRKVIYDKINSVNPPIDPTQIKLFFHKVKSNNNYVLELSIPSSRSSLLYFNSSGDTWVRLNGSKKKLQGPALQDYIIKREREKLPKKY